MGEARRVKHKVIYSGRDISDYVESVVFTDNTNITDDISIKLSDRAERWYGEWFPETGDKLRASIDVCDWRNQGDNKTYDFGEFEVDVTEYSDSVTIRGVSVPISSSMRSEEKTKGWEKLKLSAIAGEMAKKAGLSLVYEGEINPFYDRTDQNSKSDLAFLEDLCKSDGMCVKVSDKQLIIFEERVYDELPSVAAIRKGVSLIIGRPKFKRNAKNIYKACEITFTDSKSDATYKGRFEAPNVSKVGHTLKLNERFNSKSDDRNLERKAKARLREQNKKEWTMDITMADGELYFAGTNIDISGWSRFDGKYHIQTVTYNLTSGGFTTSLSCRRCLEGY